MSRRPLFLYFAQSGRRRHIVAIVFDPRLAGPASRLRSFLSFRAFLFACADCGRQDAERNPFVTLFLRFAARTVGARLLRTLLPVGALAIAARALADFAFTLFIAVTTVGDHFLAVILVLVVIAAAALGLLLFEARTAVLKHAKIMIGKLEIIFGLDAVTGQLRIARQTFILFKQLRGVATLAVVTIIAAGITRHPLGTLSTATTTTAALTIVDQVLVPCRTGARSAERPQIFPSAEAMVPSRGTGPRHVRRKSTLPCRLALFTNASAAMSSGVGGGGATFS
jgi:hypothetical protein